MLAEQEKARLELISLLSNAIRGAAVIQRQDVVEKLAEAFTLLTGSKPND